MLDNLIYSSLTEKLIQDPIYEFLNFQKKREWVSYAIVPIVLSIKTTLVASALYIGTFFFNRNAFIFNKLLAIVVKVEFVFLIVFIFKTIWFYFFTPFALVEGFEKKNRTENNNSIDYLEIHEINGVSVIYPLDQINKIMSKVLANPVAYSDFILRCKEYNILKGMKRKSVLPFYCQ